MFTRRIFFKIRNLIRLLRPAQVRLGRGACPLCAGRFLLRLQDSEAGVRCLSCRAGPVQMSIAGLILREIPRESRQHVYELSSNGSFFRFLSRESEQLTGSEFLDDTAPGDWAGSVQCQNVESLTYENESFDLCTSTDVFEHVADDAAGFRELYRVLRAGGALVMTVPLTASEQTVERVKLDEGKLVHLMEPEYHDDHLRGPGTVLCFRTYGRDILDRLAAAGFRSCRIDNGSDGVFMGYGRPVVIGYKPGDDD